MLNRFINILLVEDNPDDVELTILALEKNNIAVRLHRIRQVLQAEMER